MTKFFRINELFSLSIKWLFLLTKQLILYYNNLVFVQAPIRSKLKRKNCKENNYGVHYWR